MIGLCIYWEIFYEILSRGRFNLTPHHSNKRRNYFAKFRGQRLTRKLITFTMVTILTIFLINRGSHGICY